MKRAIGSALLALAAVLLASCATQRIELGLDVTEDLNRNSPLAVDLVVVYDEDLMADLGQMSAGEWFSWRRQVLKEHPRDLDVRSWEWVPGQHAPQQTVAYRRGAEAIVLFADYLSAAEHRIVLQPPRSFQVRLGREGFELQELAAPR